MHVAVGALSPHELIPLLELAQLGGRAHEVDARLAAPLEFAEQRRIH